MAWPHGFITRGTQKNLFERGGAIVVHQQCGRLAVGSPTVAPAHKRNQGGRQIHPFWGESVLEAEWALLIRDLVQYVGVDQAGEPIGEQVSSNTEIVAELAEAMDTTKDVTHDEQGPAVTDEIERCLDGTCTKICCDWSGGVDRGFCWRTHSELQY